jgi:hypothetical protein
MPHKDFLSHAQRVQLLTLPDDAPTGFIRQRWAKLVFTAKGIDRRFYETCVLSELSKALRAGDLWVTGSRRYKDFEEYLLPRTAFKKLQDKDGLDLAVDSDGPAYLSQRSQQLHSEMLTTAGMARAGALQDASIADGDTESGSADQPGTGRGAAARPPGLRHAASHKDYRSSGRG